MAKLAPLALLGAVVVLVGCEPTCNYENDGQYDVDLGICPVGTDLADCRSTAGGGGPGSAGGPGSGGGGGSGSGSGGPPGGAGACPGVTYPDDFEAWNNHPDPKPPPPGWTGSRDMTIQITAHCGQACILAFEIGPNSSEVRQLCEILFAFYPQVHRGQSLPANSCRVCERHRPTIAAEIDSLFEPEEVFRLPAEADHAGEGGAPHVDDSPSSSGDPIRLMK